MNEAIALSQRDRSRARGVRRRRGGEAADGCRNRVRGCLHRAGARATTSTGSNHVLPTSGAARSRGGLSAADFVRISSVQRIERGRPEAHRPRRRHPGAGRGPQRHAASISIRTSTQHMAYLYEKARNPSTGLRLHLNENTGGCSPAVLDAIRGLTAEEIALYPDYARRHRGDGGVVRGPGDAPPAHQRSRRGDPSRRASRRSAPSATPRPKRSSWCRRSTCRRRAQKRRAPGSWRCRSAPTSAFRSTRWSRR